MRGLGFVIRYQTNRPHSPLPSRSDTIGAIRFIVDTFKVEIPKKISSGHDPEKTKCCQRLRAKMYPNLDPLKPIIRIALGALPRYFSLNIFTLELYFSMNWGPLFLAPEELRA